MIGEAFQVSKGVREVRAAVERAALGVGRDPATVRVMAVVKTRGVEQIRSVVEAGIPLLGENRVQEAATHLETLGPGFRSACRVHFIGRLQANKARKALLAFDSIDSVDSRPLAERLSRIAVEEGVEREVMVEVNLGEEPQKGGVFPGQTLELARQIIALPGLVLTGLMGIPPFFDETEASRPYFKTLAALFGEAARSHPAPARFTHLSMGMSHDFPVAVEEGATLVRVGTALFGPRRNP